LTAAQGLAENNKSGYTGLVPALESAWRVGNTVVEEITSKWNVYRDKLP
jgi:purine nucleoside permease